MGGPEEPLSRQRETRVDSLAREIRLDDESPRVRADVEFDRTPVAYRMEGGIGIDGAWGSVEGRAEAGSVVEKASAGFLALIGTIIPALAFGVLSHVVGATPVISLVIAGGSWFIALVAAPRITRAR